MNIHNVPPSGGYPMTISMYNNTWTSVWLSCCGLQRCSEFSVDVCVIEHVDLHSSETVKGNERLWQMWRSSLIWDLFVSVPVAVVQSHCALCRRQIQRFSFSCKWKVRLHLISYIFKQSCSAKHSFWWNITDVGQRLHCNECKWESV